MNLTELLAITAAIIFYDRLMTADEYDEYLWQIEMAKAESDAENAWLRHAECGIDDGFEQWEAARGVQDWWHERYGCSEEEQWEREEKLENDEVCAWEAAHGRAA